MAADYPSFGNKKEGLPAIHLVFHLAFRREAAYLTGDRSTAELPRSSMLFLVDLLKNQKDNSRFLEKEKPRTDDGARLLVDSRKSLLLDVANPNPNFGLIGR